jgi:beta-N-acetylhexosaminidase
MKECLLLWLRTSGIALAVLLALLAGANADTGWIPAPPANSASRYLPPAGHFGARTVAFTGESRVLPAQLAVTAQAAEASVAGRLSARQLAGQRVIYSYQGLTPPASLLSEIRTGEAGGVIFFGSNYASRSQFSRAVGALEAANASATNPARNYPLLLMTDQEGGEVDRLPGAPVLSEKAIGAMHPLSAAETAARQAGSAAAANLRSYGINVDLAPVLDVYHQAGDFDDQYHRSYSTQQSVVSALGVSFVTALQAGGVAATVKHFPGLGAAGAGQNTDTSPVTIGLSAAVLEGQHELVYRAAIGAGVRLVMVSWAVYPQLGSGLPAGLSAVVVQGQLRHWLGFGGVTITDAIGARALTRYGSAQNRALLAARAGMDIILAASQNSAEGVLCMNGLAGGYQDGKLTRTAFLAAVTQILALRQTLSG